MLPGGDITKRDRYFKKLIKRLSNKRTSFTTLSSSLNKNKKIFCAKLWTSFHNMGYDQVKVAWY